MHEKEKQEIKESLLAIFRMGDQDEMSWKHLGHGMAAALAYGDWRQAVDYTRPDEETNMDQLNLRWTLIQDNIETMGEQEVLDWLPELELTRGEFLYLNNYTMDSWLPYHTELVGRGLNPRKGR